VDGVTWVIFARHLELTGVCCDVGLHAAAEVVWYGREEREKVDLPLQEWTPRHKHARSLPPTVPHPRVGVVLHAVEKDGDAAEGDVVREGAAIRRVAGWLEAESRLALEEQRLVCIVPSMGANTLVVVTTAHL